jgi:WD40 repeat protein
LFDLDRDGRRLVVTEDRSRHPTVFDLDRPDAPPIVLTGHVGDVIRAMFSPDGSEIGTISMDRTAKLWSPETGRLVASLDGHRGYVFALVWSPDGKRVATASVDGAVRLWDARTGAPIATFHGHREMVMRLAFDAAGSRLVTASLDGTARVFDVGATRSSIALDQRTAIALRASPDGRRLIATGTDAAAWVIDARTRAVVAEIAEHRKPDLRNRLFQSSNPISADLDATGERVALPVGREVKLIALADRERPVVRGPLEAAVTAARFAPGGRVIAATDKGAIAIWNADGAIERTLPPDDERIQDIAVHPSGLVATASKSGVAKLFRVGTADPPMDIRTDVSEGVNGVAISPSGALVATASTNDAVAIFETATGRLVAHARTISELLAVAFVDDDRVAVANRDGFVTIFDSRDGRLLAHHGDAASGWSSGLAFSPLDDAIASADDRGLIRFWSVRSDARPASEIARYVTCNIPLKLVETQIVPTPVDCR